MCLCMQVTGEANETQICEALRRYSEREGFVREALFHLFSLTHVMEKARPDILKVRAQSPSLSSSPSLWSSHTFPELCFNLNIATHPSDESQVTQPPPLSPLSTTRNDILFGFFFLNILLFRLLFFTFFFFSCTDLDINMVFFTLLHMSCHPFHSPSYYIYSPFI